MDLLVSRKNVFGLYLAASTAFAAYAVYNALWTRPNVYAAGIELSRGLHLVTLTNWLIGWSIFVGKLLQELMFGELRLIEIEHLYERAWFTLTNLLMTLAMFRSENNLLIFGMIMALIFLKIFHWILGDRLDYVFQLQQMDDSNNRSIWKVVCNRTTAMLALFLVLDYQIIVSCIDHAFLHSTDVFVVFGLDFLMVYLDLLEATLKYVLNATETLYLEWHPDEEVWENKVWINKIGAILISFFRLLAVGFVFVGLIYAYIIPVNFTRDVYVGVVKLVNQLKDFFYFLKAARDLDTHITDATEEDLQGQEMCIICRDDMTTDVPSTRHRTAPKKLPCGHVLHFGCLKSWLERSHCCPTCRREVFATEQVPEWTHHAEGDAQPIPEPGARPVAPTETDTPQQEAIEPAQGSSSIPVDPEEFSLRIPHDAVIPPDWTLLPLKRDGDDYEICLNKDKTCRFRVQHREREMSPTEFDRYVQ